uniref:Uncharacterized protein n=1 Tax=Meloidogyne enterolobii TaxID=390850 RepID=A0A6V7X3L6_MELEN|nr:unnamed protein product [Meloidogyne enterolobii]
MHVNEVCVAHSFFSFLFNPLPLFFCKILFYFIFYINFFLLLLFCRISPSSVGLQHFLMFSLLKMENKLVKVYY